jgi:hypothetical protein
MRQRFACVCVAPALLGVMLGGVAIAAFSQGGETFRTRLAPVPIDVTMQPRVAGSGSVTATLQGSRLSINGQFEGLRSPATVAHIHRASPGMQGPPVLDLNVTKAAAGAVSGSPNLTPPQLEDLRSGRLYVQIHSEGAPEGNLRGWLLP